jgi:hypothetical protein
MTPKENKNESMRVLKAKEVDKKVEKDMVELKILEAAENIEKYQKETKTWKDRKVVRKDIKTGDLVLKRKKNSENPRKLQESWEGSYIAKETNMPGAFRLLSQNGEELSYSWNADTLKRYYPCVRHGYPWVPTDQAHGHPRQVGPGYQKTRRPDSGPNQPSWRPTRPPEDLPEDSPDDLIQHDLKIWCTRQDLGGFRLKLIDGIWQDV